MVRSSSSKSTEKKSTATKTAKATQSSSKTTASARKTKASTTKSVESETKLTRKETTKSAAVTKSKAETSAKARKPATSQSTTKTAVSRSKEPAAQKKSKVTLKPTTPELFDDLAAAPDVPTVSILPALTDTPSESDVIDSEIAVPVEFGANPVPSFAGPTATDVAPAAVEPEKEVTFSFLGFNDQILAALRKQNFLKPTRVQALCLPHTLDGKDVAGFAQTGTGKTAVYLLTAAQRLMSQENRVLNPRKPHILVVVPTRELADQVSQDAKKLLSPLKLRSVALFGGVDVEKHVTELNQPTDIIVATPGRLLDLHRSKHLEFDELQMLVIDECDRMFDMGFIDDVEYVLRHLPAERVQKLLFSATGSEKVKELAFEYLENPEYIETDPVRISPEKIAQVAYAVTAEQKFLALMGHLRAHNPECGIIFTNTKVVAEWVGYKLACNGLNAEVLTGDLPQRKRMTLITKIKEGKCNLLVATDVLSRGLHVANLSHVYNFDIPDDAESFIHRIGRTARAGATGHAITLICDDYGYNMGAVEKLLGFHIPLAEVPQDYLTAEDKSDYPFDENGRVKVFGQPSTTTAKEAYEPREREHRHGDQRPVAAESGGPTARAGRPEPTLPHHRREITASKDQPSAAPERPIDRPVPAAAASAAPVATPAAPAHVQGTGPQRPQHAHGLRPQASQHSGSAHKPHVKQAPQASGLHTPKTQQPGAASGQFAGSALPRRDEKARETIEMAIQAAKKAAAKRQGTVAATAADAQGSAKNRRAGVTAQIDEIAAAVITTAQERLGGTFGNLQDRFVSRLEENFPRLSETLVRLGFFSKRFTDDR